MIGHEELNFSGLNGGYPVVVKFGEDRVKPCLTPAGGVILFKKSWLGSQLGLSQLC